MHIILINHFLKQMVQKLHLHLVPGIIIPGMIPLDVDLVMVLKRHEGSWMMKLQTSWCSANLLRLLKRYYKTVEG
jgi:hypothetical protein